MHAGVISVSLEGEERNQLVVTGFVDAVCLASMLRKKFRCVTFVSVQEVKKDKDDNGDSKNEKNNEVCYCPTPCPPPPCVPCPSYYVVYDQNPNNCCVM